MACLILLAGRRSRRFCSMAALGLGGGGRRLQRFVMSGRRWRRGGAVCADMRDHSASRLMKPQSRGVTFREILEPKRCEPIRTRRVERRRRNWSVELHKFGRRTIAAERTANSASSAHRRRAGASVRCARGVGRCKLRLSARVQTGRRPHHFLAPTRHIRAMLLRAPHSFVRFQSASISAPWL